MPSYCAACRKKNEERKFRLPNPNKRDQDDAFNKWLLFIDKPIYAEKSKTYLYKNVVICALHFKEDDFVPPGNMLKYIAVPTIQTRVLDEQSSESLSTHDMHPLDIVTESVDMVVEFTQGYTIGVCVVKDDTLCIGTHVGTVWMLKSNENNSNFTVVGRFYAHDEAVTLMDGFEEYMVTSSDQMTYMWMFKGGSFEIVRKLDVPGLFSRPTALKISNCLTFIGYESGEFCIFDFFDEEYFARTIAHKLKITAIDFSALTSFVLTASQDSYVKIWKFVQDASEAKFLYCIHNEDGPVCGAAFLNFTCTEFCTVAAESVNVKFYLKWETDDNEATESKENETKEHKINLGNPILV